MSKEMKSTRMGMSLTALSLPLLCGLFALTSCDQLGFGGTEGERLWRVHCARCHGASANGSVAYNEYPIAINLRDDKWKYGGDSGTMVDITLQGVFPAMPAFDDKLTEAQIREIIKHVRTLRGD